MSRQYHYDKDTNDLTALVLNIALSGVLVFPTDHVLPYHTQTNSNSTDFQQHCFSSCHHRRTTVPIFQYLTI